MRVRWLQHAEFEDSGCIEPWLKAQGHEAAGVRVYAGETLPRGEDFDALIVLGGPMNIYQHAEHPWLPAEKALIRAALDAGKRLLGICLGAQLIADALGGPVRRNAESEIGWFPVNFTAAGRAAPVFAALPDAFETFHWHSDTYALPPGAVRLAFSEACGEQAFAWGAGRVLALQFHLEATQAGVGDWLKSEVPTPAPYVQPAATILGSPERFEANNRWMRAVLAGFLG